MTYAGGVAAAGNLGIGSPTVEDQRVFVPIVIDSGAEGVAALNFRLRYDASVLEPVSVEPGRAALGANKQVTGNMPSPGEYVVVMMGFNQTTVSQGDVARVLFRRVGEAEGGLSRVTVEDTAFAGWDGAEMPSEGGTRVIRLDELTPEETKPPEQVDEPDSDTSEEADGPIPAAPGRKGVRSGGLMARETELETGSAAPAGPAGAAERSDSRDKATGLAEAVRLAEQARSEASAYAPGSDEAKPEPFETGELTGETIAGVQGIVAGSPERAPSGTVEQEQGDSPQGVAPEGHANTVGGQYGRLTVVAGLLLVVAGLVLMARKWLSP